MLTNETTDLDIVSGESGYDHKKNNHKRKNRRIPRDSNGKENNIDNEHYLMDVMGEIRVLDDADDANFYGI